MLVAVDEPLRQDGQWLFAGCRLMVDRTETRPSAAPRPAQRPGHARPCRALAGGRHTRSRTGCRTNQTPAVSM
jgi:hypothetical protein